MDVITKEKSDCSECRTVNLLYIVVASTPGVKSIMSLRVRVDISIA